MNVSSCHVCSKVIPSAFKQDHHVKPQAAGGGPEDEVPLCAGCHMNVHRVADMLGGPKAAEARDACMLFYADDSQGGNRCFQLAIEVMKWMRLKKDGAIVKRAHEDVEIVIQVPHAIKRALVLLGRDVRDVQTNKRLGLAGIVRKLVIDAVLAKFPALKAEIHTSVQEAKRNGEIPKGPQPSAAVMRAVKKTTATDSK